MSMLPIHLFNTKNINFSPCYGFIFPSSCVISKLDTVLKKILLVYCMLFTIAYRFELSLLVLDSTRSNNLFEWVKFPKPKDARHFFAANKNYPQRKV